MARRRTLSPEFFSDEDLSTLPFEARLLYAGLWCYADREGRLEDRPKYLKAMIFPYDRVDMEKLLTLLASPQIPDRPGKAFIHRYRVEHSQYIEIIAFVKHQKPHPHEPPSTCPDMSLHVTASSDIGIPRNDTSTLSITNDQEPKTKNQRPKTKDQKTAYGEFENVHLTDQEYGKLTQKFPDADARIENLGQYLASKGDKYKSHYATLLQWAARDKPVSPPPQPDDGYGQPTMSDEDAADLCIHGWFRTPALREKHGDPPDRDCGACREEAASQVVTP